MFGGRLSAFSSLDSEALYSSLRVRHFARFVRGGYAAPSPASACLAFTTASPTSPSPASWHCEGRCPYFRKFGYIGGEVVVLRFLYNMLSIQGWPTHKIELFASGL